MMFRKMLSTAEHLNFFCAILIILFIFLAYFLYIFLDKKLYKDLQNFLFHIKIVIYTLFIMLCIYCVFTKTIVIEIREGDEDSSVIWVLLISLLMGIYLSTSFGARGNTKYWMRYAGIFLLAYLSFTGFGYIGFRLIFNLPKLARFLLTGVWRNDVFQSNHPKGLYFFWDNLPFFSIIYGLTFTLEGEKRG